MATRTTALWIGLTAAITACAPRSALELAAVDPRGHAPVIEISNRYVQGMDVTLEVGGRRYALGNVPAFATARFVLPAEVSGAAARVTLKPTGDLKLYRTSLVRYSGVDDLRLLIGSDPRAAVLRVR